MPGRDCAFREDQGVVRFAVTPKPFRRLRLFDNTMHVTSIQRATTRSNPVSDFVFCYIVYSALPQWTTL